jgi:protein tyrosine/serine phosphatase
MTQRNIAFTSVFNFRDLGGYPTVDGRTVRWNRLYRSDDLSRLAGDEYDRFAALGIRTVVDLRRPNEVEEDGRIPQLDGFVYRNVHLAHPLWPTAEFADNGQRVAYVRERYREMSEAAAGGIGDTLRLVADAEAAPLVFHCIAGKDRTGIIAALTLSLLGVADDHIADDYELSEAAEEPNWLWRMRDFPELQRKRWTHITVSPRRAMQAFLDDLRDRHGSIEDYGVKIGVTGEHVAAMRAHLLRRS